MAKSTSPSHGCRPWISGWTERCGGSLISRNREDQCRPEQRTSGAFQVHADWSGAPQASGIPPIRALNPTLLSGPGRQSALSGCHRPESPALGPRSGVDAKTRLLGSIPGSRIPFRPAGAGSRDAGNPRGILSDPTGQVPPARRPDARMTALTPDDPEVWCGKRPRFARPGEAVSEEGGSDVDPHRRPQPED
jgi:hypothetical protein